MKNIILLIITVFITIGNIYAQTPLWQGKGRIAISSDGNEHDDDDWAATPLSLAMIAAKGLQDKLVLYTYCDHIWGSNQDRPDKHGISAYEHMRISALGSKKWFGFNNTKFICAVDNAEIAYNAMRDVINASSADDPLIIIAAGPMQVVGEAMNRADKDKRQYVTLLSHSQWNNRHSDNPDKKKGWDNHSGWTWNEMKEAFSTPEGGNAKFVQIVDQNNGKDYIGFFCKKEYFDWIKTSPARNNPLYRTGSWDFLYDRISTCIKKKGTCFDPSDAGMIVYLFTGIEKTNPDMAKEIMENPVFTYQNPIRSGIDPKGLRDCQILRDNGMWYLTGTAFPHWERQETNGKLNAGVPLYKSYNLKDWEFIKYIVERPDSTKWYYRRFWAPEVHKINGKYYATFNCSNPSAGYKGQHIGYAVADKIEGPYKVVTEDKPLANGNDLTLFQDEDGKVWAFWNRGREFGIGYAQIDLEKGKFLTEPTTAITPGKVKFEYDKDKKPVSEPGYDGRPIPKVKKYYDWDSIGIEGAYVIKENGKYYLFYSSWTRGYEIGYATADKVTGPWKKNKDNPFYGAMSKAACKKNGFKWEGNENSPFNQVGHNEIFKGPDGRYWISCHGITNDAPEKPSLVIDPIWFEKDGSIKSNGPSYTEQEIKCKK